MGVANGLEWMASEDFIKHMQHFIKQVNANKETPTLLLLDNNTYHLSIEVIDMAIIYGITMLYFPPQCAHRMQPLDIAWAVFPFNSHAFTDVDFVAAQFSGENRCDNEDEDQETQ
ncbi:unnamed protein product [Hermetia illucens]|uniref:DDE-1 domain-containing protein n=1 Tax=Hermetia illucens TaxID=343691 RepID=A0A7R8UWM6_HERIL|nr:unnamed protein product [Hermetia illucens]